MNGVRYGEIASPLGMLLVTRSDRGLSGLFLQSGPHARAVPPHWIRADQDFAQTADQLARYFAGERVVFAVDLDLEGTMFQCTVWSALCTIPYGTTQTYGDLAERVGKPGAARAVGAANARNPVSIIVPCHRVVGGDGSLTGYAGGLAAKRYLLDLESGQVGI